MAKIKIKAAVMFLNGAHSDVSVRAGNIMDCVTKAINLFPSVSPKPTDKVLANLITNFAQAIKDAKSRSRDAIVLRNSYSAQVKTLMRMWAPLVTMDSRGDLVILTASGFDNVKQPESTPVANPKVTVLTDGLKSGSVVACVQAVRGAKTYHYNYSDIDPLLAASGDYVYLPHSTSRIEVESKIPTKRDYFSLRVAVTQKVSGWSEYSSVILR